MLKKKHNSLNVIKLALANTGVLRRFVFSSVNQHLSFSLNIWYNKRCFNALLDTLDWATVAALGVAKKSVVDVNYNIKKSTKIVDFLFWDCLHNSARVNNTSSA